MIKEHVSIKEVVDFLNEIVSIDREAISHMIRDRVECNQELAKHPTVQVHHNAKKGIYFIGLLGFLNGLFGIAEDGSGSIAAVYAVVCPMESLHNQFIKKETIDNLCPVCTSQLILGDLIRFERIR